VPHSCLASPDSHLGTLTSLVGISEFRLATASPIFRWSMAAFSWTPNDNTDYLAAEDSKVNRLKSNMEVSNRNQRSGNGIMMRCVHTSIVSLSDGGVA
jgi:hypothetical protein